MQTIQSELKLFKKTGNSTHARWIANELIKVASESKLNSINQFHDVTVGTGSGGDIKSGLLWTSTMMSNMAANDARKKNAIMREALMQIRNRGRREPIAGDIAKTALEKLSNQGVK